MAKGKLIEVALDLAAIAADLLVSGETIAAVLSLILLSALFGVREGTVLSAVLVGWVVRHLQRRVPWPRRLSRP